MVAILLGNGFEEAEALVPCDILRRGGVEVALVGVNGIQIASSHNIVVSVDKTIDEVDPEQLEMLVLPGGLRGVAAMEESAPARELIRKVWDSGRYLAAICAAPALLGRMSLLEGRKAVCYPGMEGELKGALPQPDKQVVVDGNLITGQAPGAAFPFAFQLLEALKGSAAMEESKRASVYRD